MNCRSEWSHRTLDLKRMALFAVYFKYVVDPRWSSVSDLTLLLTASDMDPACEASLTVCVAHMVGLVSLDELGRCNLNE